MLLSLFIKETKCNDVNSLTKDIILDWRENILSRATVNGWNNYLRHMRALFNLAVERKIITKNYFLDVSMVKPNKQLPKIISYKLLNDLRVNCVKNMKWGWFWLALVGTLCYTGMRRRQLVALEWKDIDLKNVVIHLRSESSKNKREYFVPMNEKLINIFKKMNDNIFYYTNNKPLFQDKIFDICIFDKRYKLNKMNADHITKKIFSFND